MRVLYVKPSLVYPRTSGHDVYCYYMMKGMADEGAEVALLTAEPTQPAAVAGIPLLHNGQLSDDPAAPLPKLTWAQERFRSFWGVTPGQIASIRETVAAIRADVVVAFGLPALPYLAGAGNALRVWAMADEWIYHHLSQVQITDRSSWHHFRSAVIKGAYERAYRSMVDRFWAVSDTDLRAGRWLAGMKQGDLLPNGVDTEFYRPFPAKEVPRSAIFWGRLDFEPNIDALTWFCRDIWPGIRHAVPDATFTVIGYNPTAEVERLASAPGIALRPNVDDLRVTACEHAVVVLPMVSGGGIKNKLLEAAAMQRAIVCTPRAAMDLRSNGELPLEIVEAPREWINRVTTLWTDTARRQELGTRARSWVQTYYSWTTPARNALAAFETASTRGNTRTVDGRAQ
jgi:glycosyltransferase involved in cell wall biosynthesis